LLAGDDYLAWLTEALADIPHVKRLRIHSRLPITIPQRICQDFINWFCGSGLKPILVVHCNHPQEIDEEVEQSLQRLSQQGVTLLNQAVLLTGVNDNITALTQLSERLFAAQVMPYYLHMLDRVKGTHHFEVSETTARHLYQQLQAQLPGYLVPKLAREIPHAQSKTLLT
jgi:KamA family protein